MIDKPAGLLELPDSYDPSLWYGISVDLENGKQFATWFTVLERHKNYSLIDKSLFRAHIADDGDPAACDRLYGYHREISISDIDIRFLVGEIPDELVFGRHALHTTSIEFIHPIAGLRSFVEAPLPADLQLTLNLRRN